MDNLHKLSKYSIFKFLGEASQSPKKVNSTKRGYSSKSLAKPKNSNIKNNITKVDYNKIFSIYCKPYKNLGLGQNKLADSSNKNKIKSIQRHYPSTTKEWNNSIYSFNKQDMRSIKGLDLIINKLIKIYFSSIPLFVRKKMYHLKRRLLTNKVYISKPELKHTSSKILITLYFFAETSLYKKSRKYLPLSLRIKNQSKKLRYFNVDYLLKNIDKNYYKSIIYHTWGAQMSLFKTKLDNYWLQGILEKDKLKFFQTNHKYLNNWFKKSLIYYNNIVSCMSKIIKFIMLTYNLELNRKINKIKLRNIISKLVNVLIKNYPKSYINNRIIFSFMIIRLIKWLHLEKKKSYILQEKLFLLVELLNILKTKEKSSINNYLNKEKQNFMNEMIYNIEKILESNTKEKGLNPYSNLILSKFKFFSFINKQISNTSLIVSFNYLVKYNFFDKYLKKLGWLTQTGRDRLYPNTQVILDYIKKKNNDFFILLTEYPLKKHNLDLKIKKIINILTNYISRYSLKKIEINLIRLKYIYLNSSMLAEYLARKLITKRRTIYKAKRKLFKTIRLVYYNKYDRKEYSSPKNNLIKLSLVNKLSVVSLNSLYKKNITYGDILNLIKYKFLSGVRLLVAGRLTRRNVAARSVKTLTYIGNLKNIDSSYKSLSVVNLRGYVRPNLDKSNYNSTARTGAFNVKSWTSYYG